jgi:hypothetical protein
MSRAMSLNWEYEINGRTIYPLTLGEFSKGQDGLIEVADGEVKYKIPDQIKTIEEVETSILIKDDKEYYNAMEEFVESGESRDIYVIGRNSKREAVMTFLFVETRCSHGKKSGFDRKSKSEETKSYFLMPSDIMEIK